MKPLKSVCSGAQLNDDDDSFQVKIDEDEQGSTTIIMMMIQPRSYVMLQSLIFSGNFLDCCLQAMRAMAIFIIITIVVVMA